MGRHIALSLLLLGLFAPSVASAQENWADKGGTFGLGGNTTIAQANGFSGSFLDNTIGASGFNFRFYLTDAFGLHLTLGMNYDNQDGNDTFTLQTGLYGSVKLAPFDKGHLSAIFGADFAFEDTGPEAFNFAGVLGLFFEVFAIEQISLFASGGLRFTFVDQDLPGLGDAEGVLFTLGTGLWGSAGFTVWFD